MQCYTCKLDRPDDEFYQRKDTKHLTGSCRMCTREKSKQWALNNPEKAKIKDKNKYVRYINRPIEILPKELKCSLCKITKPTEYFTRSKYHSRGHASGCKECWRLKNKSKNRVRCHYLTMVDRDKKHGQFNTLNYEDYLNLRKQNCHYCQHSPITGLDRIDNNKGHSVDNVVPCCEECNVARSNHFTVQEMAEEIGPAIKRIREKRKISLPQDRSALGTAENINNEGIKL